MSKVLKGFKKKRFKLKKITLRTVGIATSFLVTSTTVASAAMPDVGQNAQKWVSNQMFYVAVIVVGFLLIRELLKKNTVKAVVTLIVGGVICVLIKSPTIIENVGTWILSTLGIS